MKNYACPCCGYLTLPEQPPGTYDICPVCFWEDDETQYRNPRSRGGANKVSLNEAKENFRKDGAISPDEKRYIRDPYPDEYPNQAEPEPNR
ncbi:MAG: CPCC family cysteine-rich protein [Armatimonadota bacterium]